MLFLQQELVNEVVSTFDKNVWEKIHEILNFKLEIGAFKINILSIIKI